MGLLRRLAGFLGFSREEGQEARDVEDNTDGNIAAAAAAAQAQNVPRRGFSVPIQVPVEKAQFGPILFPCSSRDGAIQVFKRRLYSFIVILTLILLICFKRTHKS